MYKILLILPIFIAMASCQPPVKGSDEINKMIVERDSLKTAYRKIGKAIVKLETKLAELDTTRKLTVVTSYRASRADFSHYFEVYGSVNALNNAVLSPEIGGTINKILVKDGDQVKKGQPLLEIDDDLVQNNIQEVKTQLDLAKLVYEKQKNLWDQNIGSELQYLQAKTNYESLNVKLQTLYTQLGKLKLLAPYDGRVDVVFAKKGELSGPQVPALRLVNLNAVYLKADIPENYYSVIKKGTPVSVEFPAMNVSIDTVISQTGYFINSANRTFSIRIEFDNKEADFLPNMLGLVKIKDYHAANAVVLPASLLQEDSDGKSFVYVLENNEEGVAEVTTRIVEIGPTYKGITEIKSGLDGTELLVNEGARNVSGGQQVEVIK